jgi:transcriptional regulator with PAS, ATPase and Fis domain
VPSNRPADDRTHATLDDFWSSDAAMQACLDRARLAAQTDLPILILGESGAGKTILARAIHNSSARKGGPFIAFNAAALSETLLDSQLFGHERGAFTGAQHRVKGKFELADRGTLFLDEVADLSPLAQSKILRAVETGEFERLGSEALQRADVRLVSATHYPLASRDRRSGFREDLFFRISGITLTLPSLRDRPKDLPILVATEIANASQQQRKPISALDRAAVDKLLAYAWPGNLRELSTVIHAAVALAKNEVLSEDLVLLPDAPPADAGAVTTISEAAPVPVNHSLRDAVHRHIDAVLQAVGGNKRRAARELGVSRATLDRKLREMTQRAKR